MAMFTCAGCGKHSEVKHSEVKHSEIMPRSNLCLDCAPGGDHPRLTCAELGLVGACLARATPTELTVRRWFEAHEHLLPINSGETYRVTVAWRDETTSYDIAVNWGPMFSVERV